MNYIWERETERSTMTHSKKERCRERRCRRHVGVFGHHKKRKFHGTVLNVVASNDLTLALGKIEREAVTFGVTRGHKNDQRNRL